MRSFIYIPLILAAAVIAYGFNSSKNTKAAKVLTNDHYNFVSVNEIMMYISNNGDGSHDPNTDSQGLYWPGGINATKAAVFEDGLIWGGVVNGDTMVGGSTYRHGLQAGVILSNGAADDPNLPKYRVYKVLDGWENLPPGPERDQYEMDYNEWPAEDGAPFNDINHDGIYTPGIDNPYIGDETMWCVSNDLDPSRTTFLYGSMPMGLEVQTLVYAFNQSGSLGNTVFKKYKIINKGQKTIEDMRLAYFEDDDLGDGNDDYSGCDIGLNLGYTHNGTANDLIYGSAPPAVGHMFVQGPIVPGGPSDSAYFNDEWRPGFRNLPMTSFIFYINGSSIYQDPTLGDPQGGKAMYNYMTGKNWDGSQYIDPNTGEPTLFALSGDPVAQTGWREGSGGWIGGPYPGDRRSIISAGPFTMAPGDTQEVVAAIFLAQGTSTIQSVAALKESALEIQNYYGAYTITGVKDAADNKDEGFELMQNYPNPFNPITNIVYKIPKSSLVTLKIYDVLGNEVATLVNEEKPAGFFSVKFDGSSFPSGVYFYKISAGNYSDVKKLILLK